MDVGSGLVSVIAFYYSGRPAPNPISYVFIKSEVEAIDNRHAEEWTVESGGSGKRGYSLRLFAERERERERAIEGERGHPLTG